MVGFRDQIMQVKLTKMLDCTEIGSGECTERVLTALGNSPELNLTAKSANDTVHGSITIVHNLLPDLHLISVEVYEANLAAEPRDGGRKSTLARPEVFPTKQTIVDSITKLTTQPVE